MRIVEPTEDREAIAQVAGTLAWVFLRDWHDERGLQPPMNLAACAGLARATLDDWKDREVANITVVLAKEVLCGFGFTLILGRVHEA